MKILILLLSIIALGVALSTGLWGGHGWLV